MIIDLPELWDHQKLGTDLVFNDIIENLDRESTDDYTHPVMPTPTGGGKSISVMSLMLRLNDLDIRTVFLVNRRTLVTQFKGGCEKYGIDHSVIASGMVDEDGGAMNLICAADTLVSRVLKKKTLSLPSTQVVFVEEAHLQKTGGKLDLISEFKMGGATIVAITATPIGISHIYNKVHIAGTKKELRECKSHLPAMVYAPDEPDMKHIKKMPSGEFNANDTGKYVQQIFGRVLEHYHIYNPDGKPTILFAPGVKESIWFTDQFEENGVSAVHIDGDDIYLKGEVIASDPITRQNIFDDIANGEIKIICNRFVMREGIDIPELYHGILACPIGSFTSYVQVVGRILRYHESLADIGHVVIQDHGGCLDDKTEVLTPNGWIGVDGIKEESQVAGYNIETGEISWQEIESTHDRITDESEEMYEAIGRSCNIRVTGNHKIVHQFRTSDKHNKEFWPESFKLRRADKISQSKTRFRIPLCGVQESDGVDLTDDEISFIGWWITDGTMNRTNCSISQANHQKQIKDLRECLIGCGFDFTETVSSGRKDRFSQRPITKFNIPKGTCKSKPRKGWAKLEAYLDKSLSSRLEELDVRQFKIFLHAIHLGDGSKDRCDGSYRISTGQKIFADRLQSMCVRRGFSCSISEFNNNRKNTIYILNITSRTALNIHGLKSNEGRCRLELTETGGGFRVWCVANKLKTLVIRRNGKVCIIGNSWHRHGSPNADYDWEEMFYVPDRFISAARYDEFAEGVKPEPIRCPKCALARKPWIKICPNPECQWQSDKGTRVVIQTNGELREVHGKIAKSPNRQLKDKTIENWKKMVFASRKSTSNRAMTFKSCEAMFYHTYGYYPPRDIPMMPKTSWDMMKKIRDVPMSALINPKAQAKDLLF